MELALLEGNQSRVDYLGDNVHELAKLREASVKTRDAAVAQIEQDGTQMQTTKVERAVTGLAKQARGAILERFIPIAGAPHAASRREPRRRSARVL